MKPRSIILAALLLFSAACGRDVKTAEKPHEPGPDSLGFYCRMTLAEHQGPKGQIFLKGMKEPFWFSSVRDALTYVANDIVSERELSGFWVNDMAQGTWEKPAPGSWIDARTAWYVIGSNKSSGMGGGEVVPFREKAAATVFAQANGGRVTGYAEAGQTAIDTSGVPPPPEGSGT